MSSLSFLSYFERSYCRSNSNILAFLLPTALLMVHHCQIAHHCTASVAKLILTQSFDGLESQVTVASEYASIGESRKRHNSFEP
jgi:hypothetical protein